MKSSGGSVMGDDVEEPATIVELPPLWLLDVDGVLNAVCREVPEACKRIRVADGRRVAEANDWGCVCGAKVRPGSGEVVVCDSPHAVIHGCPYGGVFEGFLPEGVQHHAE